MSLNPSKIDYLYHAKELIGRDGRSLNIVTGCKHWESNICNIPCYARRLVEDGYLKDSPAYPYDFEPTFHPERIKHYGGKPKLIFLNDMGDVGCDTEWEIHPNPLPEYDTDAGRIMTAPPLMIAQEMVRFANLNPQHIILLLTKNPAWYGLVEWPDNVWCGFTATNNDELKEREIQFAQGDYNLRNKWISLEPWLDHEKPDPLMLPYMGSFVALGGQTNPARPISKPTVEWAEDHYIHGQGEFKLFIKDNHGGWNLRCREYPDAWKFETSTSDGAGQGVESLFH